MAMGLSRRELYLQVARLHVANINQGFLSTLGVRFVALMYRAIDECESSTIFVDEVGGRVIGFVAGATSGMRPIYARMLHYWPSLLIALCPSFIRPRRVRRILETLRYSRMRPAKANLPDAELLSIAVDSGYRGQQRADALYRRLAAYFHERGDLAFKITVGKALSPAHRFYQRMGAIAVTDVQVHEGSASIVYVQDIQGMR